MHIRYVSARARRAAVKHYDRLVREAVVVPPQRELTHMVKSGDTLSELAERYQTLVKRIVDGNSLPSTMIRIGQRLTIREPVDIRAARAEVVVPRRRLPKRNEARKAQPPAPARLTKRWAKGSRS